MRQRVQRERFSKEGFSLVELIITIAIMAILVGGAALGFGLLRSADSLGAAQKINSSLNDLKTRNMAAGKKIYMNLYLHDGDYYIRFSENAAISVIDGSNLGKKIADERIEIKFKNGSATEETIASDVIYSFTIQKSDGAFGESFYKTANGAPSLSPLTLSSPTILTTRSKSSSTTHKVVMITSTGRHYMDDEE